MLTGINLMRTGEVQADLRELPGRPAYLAELMAAKAEAEHAPLRGLSVAVLSHDVAALQAALDEAEVASRLPNCPRPRRDCTICWSAPAC
jgi:uncharacterized protein